MRRRAIVLVVVAAFALPGNADPQESAAPVTCESALRASRLELDYYARSKAQDLSNAIKVIADQQMVIDRLKVEVDRLKAATTPKAPAP